MIKQLTIALALMACAGTVFAEEKFRYQGVWVEKEVTQRAEERSLSVVNEEFGYKPEGHLLLIATKKDNSDTTEYFLVYGSPNHFFEGLFLKKNRESGVTKRKRVWGSSIEDVRKKAGYNGPKEPSHPSNDDHHDPSYPSNHPPTVGGFKQVTITNESRERIKEIMRNVGVNNPGEPISYHKKTVAGFVHRLVFAAGRSARYTAYQVKQDINNHFELELKGNGFSVQDSIDHLSAPAPVDPIHHPNNAGGFTEDKTVTWEEAQKAQSLLQQAGKNSVGTIVYFNSQIVAGKNYKIINQEGPFRFVGYLIFQSLPHAGSTVTVKKEVVGSHIKEALDQLESNQAPAPTSPPVRPITGGYSQVPVTPELKTKAIDLLSKVGVYNPGELYHYEKQVVAGVNYRLVFYDYRDYKYHAYQIFQGFGGNVEKHGTGVGSSIQESIDHLNAPAPVDPIPSIPGGSTAQAVTPENTHEVIELLNQASQSTYGEVVYLTTQIVRGKNYKVVIREDPSTYVAYKIYKGLPNDTTQVQVKKRAYGHNINEALTKLDSSSTDLPERIPQKKTGKHAHYDVTVQTTKEALDVMADAGVPHPGHLVFLTKQIVSGKNYLMVFSDPHHDNYDAYLVYQGFNRNTTLKKKASASSIKGAVDLLNSIKALASVKSSDMLDKDVVYAKGKLVV